MSLVPNSVYSAPDVSIFALSGSTGGTGQAGPNLLVSTLTVNSNGTMSITNVYGGGQNSITLSEAPLYDSEDAQNALTITNSQFGGIYGDLFTGRLMLTGQSNIGSGNAAYLDSSSGGLSINAFYVNMSSLQVSSINGAIPSGGQVGPAGPTGATGPQGGDANSAFSTVTMNPTGAFTFPTTYVSSLNISSINGAVPGTGGTGAGPNLLVSTLNVNATGYISAPTIFLSSIQSGGGPLKFNNIGAIEVEAGVDMNIASANVSFTSPAQISASSADLTISSINGAAPGGGVVGCNGVFSTLNISSLTNTSILIAKTAFFSSIRADEITVSTFSTATLTAANGLFSTLTSISTSTSNLTVNTINGVQASVSTFTASGPMTLQQVNGSNYLWSNSTVLLPSNASPQNSGLWTGTVEVNYQTSNWLFGSNTDVIGTSAYYNLGVRTTYGSYLGGPNQAGMLGNYSFDPISNLDVIAITIPFTSGSYNSISPGATQNIITNLTTNNILPLDDPPVAPTVTYTLLRLA